MLDDHMQESILHATLQSIAYETSIRTSPNVIYKPRLFKDGNEWCALLGDNIQDGVAGFGKTPEKAFEDFDRSFCGA